MIPSEFQSGRYYYFKHYSGNIVVWKSLGDTCQLIKAMSELPGRLQRTAALHPREEHPEDERWHELTDEIAARLL